MENSKAMHAAEEQAYCSSYLTIASGTKIIACNDVYGESRVIKAQIMMGHGKLQGNAYR
jgi:hypothetical protein